MSALAPDPATPPPPPEHDANAPEAADGFGDAGMGYFAGDGQGLTSGQSGEFDEEEEEEIAFGGGGLFGGGANGERRSALGGGDEGRGSGSGELALAAPLPPPLQPLLSPDFCQNLRNLGLDWLKVEPARLQAGLARGLRGCGWLKRISLAGYQGDVDEVRGGGLASWVLLCGMPCALRTPTRATHPTTNPNHPIISDSSYPRSLRPAPRWSTPDCSTAASPTPDCSRSPVPFPSHSRHCTWPTAGRSVTPGCGQSGGWGGWRHSTCFRCRW
jgi:hypothetical protein